MALDPFEIEVLRLVRRHRLLASEDRVLVACSAGPDSTALLAALCALRDAGAVGSIVAAHVDHQLRAGGDEDAALVARHAAALGAGFTALKVEVGPGNLQAQARGARYSALAAEAARAGASRIATGHTRTDQAETVLLRLLRGAGARGLSAIPRRRGALIRPLLSCGREAVLAYLARRGLAWRQDPSNLTGRYARNRLRLEVWPLLRRDNPRLEEALARTADLLREDERALGAQARALLAPADGGVPLAALRQAPRAVQRRAIRRLATRAARRGQPGEPRLEARHVEAALALLRPGAPRRAGLRGGLEAAVEGGRLVVRRLEAAAGAAPGSDQVVAIQGPGRYTLAPGGAGISVTVEGGSPPGLAWPLFLRTRRAGDRIRPAGGRGGKSLKAWLIDRKVERSRRDGLLLVVDAGGQVLAIPELGVRSRDLPAEVAVRVTTAE